MSEYIEREAAIKFVKEQMEEVNNKTAKIGSCVTETYDMAIRHAIELLRYVPTAVVEVRHGEWIEWHPPMHMIMTGEELLYRCSVCDAKYPDVEGYRYCPHCGAKMDGDTE